MFINIIITAKEKPVILFIIYLLYTIISNMCRDVHRAPTNTGQKLENLE